VAIQRSSAAETAALVRELVGADAIKREAAAARLAILGARAVPCLLESLEGAAAAGQIAILHALEAIGESRALTRILPLADSSDVAVAVAAVGAIGAHVNAVNPRSSADALDALSRVSLDASRPEAVRLAALQALSAFSPDVLAAMRERLEADRSPRIRSVLGREPKLGQARDLAAARLEAAAQGLQEDPDTLRMLIREAGEDVGLALLHELVLGVRERERATAGSDLARWRAARTAAHVVLAERGSRLALFDLRESLDSVTGGALDDLVRAAQLVGDSSCLAPLASAWTRQADGDRRNRLAAAFDAIRGREKLTRRHAAIRDVLARFPSAAGLVR
jgi:hypothetical protein